MRYLWAIRMANHHFTLLHASLIITSAPYWYYPKTFHALVYYFKPRTPCSLTLLILPKELSRPYVLFQATYTLFLSSFSQSVSYLVFDVIFPRIYYFYLNLLDQETLLEVCILNWISRTLSTHKSVWLTRTLSTHRSVWISVHRSVWVSV